jgi:hypothetical protein
MVESATKGAILMYSKEFLNDSLLASGFTATTSGTSAGVLSTLAGRCTQTST